MPRFDGLDHRLSPSARQVDVEQHDVGHSLGDQLDGRSDLVGFPDDLDRVADLAADPGRGRDDGRRRGRRWGRGPVSWAPGTPRDTQLDLGTFSGHGTNDGSPTVALHPAADRL